MEKWHEAWDKKLTVILIVLAALFEAADQGLKSSSRLAATAPNFVEGTLWHIAPLLLLIFAGVVWLIGSFLPKEDSVISQTQNVSAQLAASAITPAATSPIDVDEFFRTNYSGQLQVETERNIRGMIQSRPQNEREEFAIRFIATGIVSFVYERVWWTIFKSQVLALQDLNRKAKIVRREEVKLFYDAAALESPTVYSDYSFAKWMSYLRGQGLIIEHPGETLEITIRGKDFLKYMVHWGYTENDRRY
jgi:hypothetical protein